MTPEQTLWQDVVLRAVMDATYAGNDEELRDEMRKTDRWLRGRGPDFRMGCLLAGLDPDFIAEAYAEGRIDPVKLRSAVEQAA